MNTNIIDRLTDTLNAKTEAALTQLANLEAQVADAIARAEADATARIESRLANVLATTDEALSGFVARITAHAADAFSRAVDGLHARLAPVPTSETITAPEQPQETQEMPIEPVAIPTPDINSPEWLTEVNRRLDEQAERERTTPAVAAQVVECERPAMIDDTEDDEDDDQGDQEATDDPRGLYERRGSGRGSRYEEVPLPVPGMSYFRKSGKKWVQARYIG